MTRVPRHTALVAPQFPSLFRIKNTLQSENDMFDAWTIFLNLSDPLTLLLMALSACFGIIMGAIPGLSGTLGIALLLPFTFGLEPALALLMLGSVYCGSEYGGSIPAILLNTPGTAAALCTTFDGHPMALAGQAQKALATALIASVVGGIFGVSALLFLSMPLAMVSMQFGAPEQFWLCVFALTIISSLSSGHVLKGLMGGLFGLVLACVGMDPMTGFPRFTFNSLELMSGINVIPTLIGLFAIPQALLLLKVDNVSALPPFRTVPGVFWNTTKEFFRRIWVIIVAGTVGVIVGIMPGAGGNIATFIAYNETKRFAKNPDQFGKGAIEGIMAPEICNNAVVGGAQIPLLTLGIPGSAPAAVLLGALMTHGLRPGFSLFAEQGNIVFTYVIGLFIANLMILVLGSALVRAFIFVLKIPQHFLLAGIFAMSIVGAYAISSSAMDVLSMAAAGILGYALIRFKFGVAPLALGLILGTTMEEGFKLSVHLGAAKGDVLWFFVSRPQSLVLIGLTLLSLGYSLYKERKDSLAKQAKQRNMS